MAGAWWLRVNADGMRRAGGKKPARRNVTEQSAPPPSDVDLEMMTRALALADVAGGMGEVPIGAVVYRLDAGGAAEILGEGFNTRERDADPSAHAEFKAIVQAAKTIGDWRLEHCSLAVTLEPCPMCAGAIINARVARVLYGADDPKAGAVRSLFTLLNDSRLNHRPQVLPGVMDLPAGEKLTAFFRGLRTKRKG